MNEYKLIGKNNRPVTIDNFEETNKSIEEMFPVIDKNKIYDGLRVTYGANGELIHVYYEDRKSRILLPRKYENSIKERLEVMAKIRLEEIKCL